MERSIRKMLCVALAAAFLLLAGCSAPGDKGILDKDSKGSESGTTADTATSRPSASSGSGTSHNAGSNQGNRPGGGLFNSKVTTSDVTSHNHVWFEYSAPPTCEADGGLIRTCSCGTSEYLERVPAFGHNWSDWQTVTEPDVETEGSEERRCNDCGKTETRAVAKLPSGDMSEE